MSMDLYARNDDSVTFSANAWTWRPLNSLMLSIGAIDESMHYKMSFNDGDGPNGERTRVITDRLNKWLHINQGVTEVHLPEVDGVFDLDYFTPRERILEFMEFCDKCITLGGFVVF